MAVASTYQNSIGSVPVLALDPPPEGTQVANVTFTLQPIQPAIAVTFQFNSPGGFSLSQVVTLFIDNSQNAYPITVVHGALNETVNVAAKATVIVPTFSNKQPYAINVAVANGVSPQSPLIVPIAFMNYARAPGTFSSTSNLTIIGTGQNVAPLIANTFAITYTGADAMYPLGYAGFPNNYILDSVEVYPEFVSPEGGQFYWFLVTSPDSNIAHINTHICAGVLTWVDGPAGGALQSGAGVTHPVNLTWPLGLAVGRNVGLYLYVTELVAPAAFATMRINVSGCISL